MEDPSPNLYIYDIIPIAKAQSTLQKKDLKDYKNQMTRTPVSRYVWQGRFTHEISEFSHLSMISMMTPVDILMCMGQISQGSSSR